MHFALGVFQDFTEDTDFFTELAVFTTKLSIKDTSQVGSALISLYECVFISEDQASSNVAATL